MSGSENTMRYHLTKIPLYDKENIALKNEICAYARVIDELNTAIKQMLSECFITTAQSYGLEKKEMLIGNKRDDLSVLQRRQMLLDRESIDSESFTKLRIKQAIKSFALTDCTMTEYPSLYLVAIEIYGDFSFSQKEWIKAQIKKILPAHLRFSVSFNGCTWEYSDNKNNSFSYIDSLDYSWDKIDNLA